MYLMREKVVFLVYKFIYIYIYRETAVETNRMKVPCVFLGSVLQNSIVIWILLFIRVIRERISRY